MAQFAPALPTTAELHMMFTEEFTPVAQARVSVAREHVSGIIRGDVPEYLAIIGPCAMTDTVELDIEGDQLFGVTQQDNGLYALHRMPPWKPRTDPDKWHGLETSDPVTAYTTVVRRASATANVAMEFGNIGHAQRYGRFATLGWIGGRNVEDTGLVKAIALHPDTRSMPLGIKNGLDGNVDQALEQVELVNKLRGEDGAPAVLIYRGGENAKTPDDWETQYKQALRLSGGALILDKAHGSEMAHHPTGRLEKSVDGQMKAMLHYLGLIILGHGALGSMYEASEAKSPTDPVIPFEAAVVAALQSAAARRRLLVPA